MLKTKEIIKRRKGRVGVGRGGEGVEGVGWT